jgi:hypothetical protein
VFVRLVGDGYVAGGVVGHDRSLGARTPVRPGHHNPWLA